MGCKIWIIGAEMEKKKGVVIGGGCAGLAAAAFLAKGGHEITVYEQHTAPGGYWASFKRGGFIFDIGPHWTIMPERIAQTFTELGVEPARFERMDTIGHYTLPEEGFDLVLARDRKAIEDAIARSFPTARMESVRELNRRVHAPGGGVGPGAHCQHRADVLTGQGRVRLEGAGEHEARHQVLTDEGGSIWSDCSPARNYRACAPR